MDLSKIKDKSFLAIKIGMNFRKESQDIFNL
jgi:hypothetical protein